MAHALAQTHVPGDALRMTTQANASVISTTSLQNLVTRVRDNTLYDPALGLGERGNMGRFDAQKRNTYLYPSLNRRQKRRLVSLRG